MQELNGISRGFRSLKKFMKNQKELIELPQVSDLRQFIESDAVFTFSRFSEYHALPQDQKNKLYTFPIPTQEITTTPCYVTFAAVPLGSSNPIEADKLVRYMIEHVANAGTALIQLDALPLSGLYENNNLTHPFPENTIFIPRETSGAFHEKAVLDFLNGKMEIEEVNGLWEEFYFFSSSITSDTLKI